MGCFDRVYMTCPNCGYSRVEFQSKAGECSMSEFDQDRVPLDIAADIEGDVETCPQCGTEVVAVKVLPIDYIPMKAKIYTQEDRRKYGYYNNDDGD